MHERTFSIIKPDAVAAGLSGAILAEIDQAGFRFVAIRKESITKREAEGFYAVHSSKPFFSSLTDFMSSGPLYLMVLEKDNAIADLRKLMGATNPANAEEEPSARSLLNLFRRMRSTAPTQRKRRPSRSAIGSPATS